MKSSRSFLLLSLLLFISLLSGCVKRRFIIRADPPQARVFVDGFELEPDHGITSQSFTFHGEHRVIVRHRGYQTFETSWVMAPRWFSLFPIDFFTELLWPGTIEDIRELRVKLKPTEPQNQESIKSLTVRSAKTAEEADVELR